MASGLYDSARLRFLRAGTDWVDDDIRVMLLKSTYSFVGTHEFVDDIVSHESDATDYARQVITSPTVSDATTTVIDCDDPTWAGLGGVVNNDIAGMAFYKHSGTDYDATTINVDTNRPLIAYVDVTDFNTQDQTITFDLPATGVYTWAG